MALAMMYPEDENNGGGRGKKSKTTNLAETSGFSGRRARQARAVLHYSRPLAEEVVRGTKHLDQALANN
jgi:hypothetical protein